MVVVGIDYGRKRTGVAVFIDGIILPAEPVMGGWKEIQTRIEDLSVRYGGFKVVLGLPLSALGKATELSREVEQFAERLRKNGYTVETVDEVRTSIEAADLLGMKDRKGRVDSLAACEILKRHLGKT